MVEAGQRHLDELPLDEVEQAPVPSGRPCQRFGERRRAVGGGRRPELLDLRHDLRLPAAGSAALAERASRPRTGVRPVELDDLHRELPRGEEVRRGAVAGGVLKAEVEEGEEDGVLIGGGEAALVEELEDALGEGKGSVGVGEQRENPWRRGWGSVKGSRERPEVRRGPARETTGRRGASGDLSSSLTTSPPLGETSPLRVQR